MAPISTILDVAWDTDIGRDPDDALALLWMLSRPEIRLRCITITPGDRDQVALTRFLLREAIGLDIPVGTMMDRERGKKSVSGCHLALMERYGEKPVADPDGEGAKILQDTLTKHPRATLLTTGPLNNVGNLLKTMGIAIERSVSMGGYFGAANEPSTMPEFNFNGCGWATRWLVETKRIGRRLLVGKNITHSVVYDSSLHKAMVAAANRNRALALIAELMTLRSSRSAKKLHDPLAATALLREDMFSWQEVMPFKHNGEWGSKPSSGSGLWAATSVSLDLFRGLFAGCGPIET